MNLFKKHPKVACPKCKTIHDINPESTCPNCGTKYRLPQEYSANNKASSESTPIKDVISQKFSALYGLIKNKYSSLKSTTRRLITLILAIVGVSVVFTLVLLLCFTDKEPVLYNTAEPENQPIFYMAGDDMLYCLFPNGRNIELGVGVLRDSVSSANGKDVYLVFSGKLTNSDVTDNSDGANYIVHISDFKKLSLIYTDSENIPEILLGGDSEYLYIRTPTPEQPGFGTLLLSRNGKEPRIISSSVRDLCISPNGRHALFSVDDSGASKLMRYDVSANEVSNPGIKNSFPLSVDNKGEYLVYAKTGAESLSIVCEKNTSDRIEIPIIADTALSGIIFSKDRRAFAIEYTDRTTFYECGTAAYSTVLTYSGSRFGYDLCSYVDYNLLDTALIPQISDSHSADLLPYYFYDKERQGIYCVESDGSKVPVFDRTFTEVKVSESGHAAFVSDGKLYSGKLSHRSNELCEIADFEGKTLVDITPDGKRICYTDSDGNLFTVNYGEKKGEASKLFVDPEFVRFSDNGKTALISSDNVTSFVTKDKTVNLCIGIIPKYTAVSADDLSNIIYAKEEYEDGVATGKISLYLYSDGKSKAVSTDFISLNAPDFMRVDRTLSDYTDIFSEEYAEKADAE